MALPGLEFAYVFLGIAHAPRDIVKTKMLPQVDALLSKLDAHKGKPWEYENGHGYWDDLCLARFMQGICLRYIAYPVWFPFILCYLPTLHVDVPRIPTRL